MKVLSNFFVSDSCIRFDVKGVLWELCFFHNKLVLRIVNNLKIINVYIFCIK
jgi:hypothetical protein